MDNQGLGALYECFNIEREILEFAEALNKSRKDKGTLLDAVGTGGGCDFIYRELLPERETGEDGFKRPPVIAVLGSSEHGQSPDCLDETCSIVIYTDGWAWYDAIEIFYPSAREALVALSEMMPHQFG